MIRPKGEEIARESPHGAQAWQQSGYRENLSIRYDRFRL
jgi:hypothetical protein